MKVRPLLFGARQKTRGGAEHEHDSSKGASGLPPQHLTQGQRQQHHKEGNDRHSRSASPMPIPIPGAAKDRHQQGKHSAASSLGDKVLLSVKAFTTLLTES